jgi:hypothetical protein
MGEIRSTLDIIMEKAKDVAVTDEDKAVFMRREVEGKVRGVLQKYLDRFMDAKRLQEEMDALDADRRDMAVAALRRESLGRLVLDGDNGKILEILSRAVGMDTTPVKDLILQYQQDLQTRQVEREAALRGTLTDRGISGSAVRPNLKADPEWMRDSTEVRDRFHREVAALYQ